MNPDLDAKSSEKSKEKLAIPNEKQSIIIPTKNQDFLNCLHHFWWGNMQDLLKNQNYNLRKESWLQKYSPKMKFRLWSQDTISLFIKDNYKNTWEDIYFQDLQTDQERVQVANYMILDKFGGIIAHNDIELIKKLPEQENNLIMFVKNTSDAFSTQFIASAASTKFWGYVLSELSRKLLSRKYFKNEYESESFDQFMGGKFLYQCYETLKTMKPELIQRIKVIESKEFIGYSKWTETKNYLIGPSDLLYPATKPVDVPENTFLFDWSEHRWVKGSFQQSAPFYIGIFIIFVIAVIVISFILYEHLLFGRKAQQKAQRTKEQLKILQPNLSPAEAEAPKNIKLFEEKIKNFHDSDFEDLLTKTLRARNRKPNEVFPYSPASASVLTINENQRVPHSNDVKPSKNPNLTPQFKSAFDKDSENTDSDSNSTVGSISSLSSISGALSFSAKS
jgi:hypothetical protein